MRTRRSRLNRSLAGAAALLALLLAVLLWQARQSDNDDPMTTATLADVGQIRIKRAGQPALILQRGAEPDAAADTDSATQGATRDDNATWAIVQPFVLPANPRRIEPLLAVLTMGGEGYAPDEVDLPATGLAEPAASLHIDDLQIDIGAADVSGTRRYARRDGRVVLLDDWVLSLIDGGVTAFARLAPFDQRLTAMQELTAERDTADARVTLADWRSLDARQIVAWPTDEPEVPLGRSALSARLDDATQRDYTVIHTARYTALHPVGAGFAYVIANEDWPCPNSRKSKPRDAASSPGC